jgi:hypothetical protein
VDDTFHDQITNVEALAFYVLHCQWLA